MFFLGFLQESLTDCYKPTEVSVFHGSFLACVQTDVIDASVQCSICSVYRLLYVAASCPRCAYARLTNVPKFQSRVVQWLAPSVWISILHLDDSQLG